MKKWVIPCSLFFVCSFFFPNAVASVGLENKLGVRVPIETLHFLDETGHPVQLGQYFHPGKPVLLALVYYGCPGACTVLLNHLIATLTHIAPSPGRAFEIAVVSIDPKESPKLAQAKKQSYLKIYSRPETAAGWHFLTGEGSQIETLSRTLGFHYDYDSQTGVFSHPSVVFVLTPQGVLSEALPGIDFSSKTLRAALYSASRGRIQAFFDRWTAICSAYLPHRGILNSPERWLAAFGILTLLFISLLFYRFFNRRRRSLSLTEPTRLSIEKPIPQPEPALQNLNENPSI